MGKPYLPGRTRLRARTEYVFRSDRHELLLCYYDLDDQTVEEVKTGECEFALLLHRDVIFFLYRFGRAIPWNDAPHSWYRLPEAQRQPPSKVPNLQSRAVLHVLLVDADRNIVRAVRAVTLSSGFTAKLHVAIQMHANNPCNPVLYDLEITEAYQNWPGIQEMLAAATDQCRGE